MSYAEYTPKLARLSPLDYADPMAVGLLSGLGDLLDELTARASAALLAGTIYNAPEDGLELLGKERALKRFPREGLEVWRDRVAGAFDFWQLAGTLAGVQLALSQAGYRAQGVEHFRDPDQERWAEFSVYVVPANPIDDPGTWGDGMRWGEGRKWGFDANAVPLDSLYDLIQEVKPAHARLRHLGFRPRANYWGGELTWGQGRTTNPLLNFAARFGLKYGLGFDGLVATDSGATWGGDREIVLYDLYGGENA